jgi:hypothetical protein
MAEEWEIRMGLWGVEVDLPPKNDGVVGRVSAEHVRATIVDLAQPAIEAGDLALAVRSALHAAARAQRRWSDPRFYPLLAPLPPASKRGVEIAMDRTWWWGVPLASVIVLAYLAARRGIAAPRQAEGRFG